MKYKSFSSEEDVEFHYLRNFKYCKPDCNVWDLDRKGFDWGESK